MTTYNKTTLKTFFETGDVPTGTDYANFIDSYVNIVETGNQTMAGSLTPTELITPRVSCANLNVTGTLSAGTIAFSNVRATIVSATTIYNDAYIGQNVSSTVIGADQITYNSSLLAFVATVSATGTAQGTAALIAAPITRGAGVTDSVSTGFLLQGARTGKTQYIVNGAASANLWPPTGGKINVLASNAAFGMTANTLYTIIHLDANSMAVK